MPKEFPKMLYKSKNNCIVKDKEAESLAIKDGFALFGEPGIEEAVKKIEEDIVVIEEAKPIIKKKIKKGYK